MKAIITCLVLALLCSLTAAQLDMDTICGGECTAADNATLAHDNAEIPCLNIYHTAIVDQQCGFPSSIGGHELYKFFCALTEAGEHCHEVVPDSRLTFSYYTTTATELRDEFGCCYTNLVHPSPRYNQTLTTCDVLPTAPACPLSVEP